MTRTLLLGAVGLSLMLASGCYSGPPGTRGPFTSGPPNQVGAPANRPPIAVQPGPMSGGTASSVRVVPYAAISRNAMVPLRTGPVPNGLPVASGIPFRGGTQPLALLAANDRMLDGRSLPMISRDAQLQRYGGVIAHSQSQSEHPSSSALVPGIAPSPQEDLKYRGGRTIRDLTYVNLYVGGQDAWDPQDWRNIDKTLAAAMSDAHLNNVLVQYFGNQPIKSTFQGSYFLTGWRPQFVAKGDIERQIRSLNSSGSFNGFDLPNTVLNFMLPRGTVLGDPNTGEQLALQSKASSQDEAEDSTSGLGGYHGSIRIGASTIYYSTAVYSERLPNGGTNGIPVFDQNWKNVVATTYHELQEARTDPDVDDAIRDGTANGARFLGWTSDSGLEIGDHPIAVARPLTQVFVEVPLANGGGLVPVQLLYSNFAHGPERPIPYPHGMEPPNSNPPNPEPSPTQPSIPNTTDPELAKLISQWNQLEDFVKKAIIRLAESR